MTDVVEAPYSKYVTVMWPVSDSPVYGAHCTSVFLGLSDDLEARGVSKTQIIDTLKAYHFDAPNSINVSTYEVFGGEWKVIVGVLDYRVESYRVPIVDALWRDLKLEEDTTYPYRGHVTLGHRVVPSLFQRSFYLGAPQLWWGDRRYQL